MYLQLRFKALNHKNNNNLIVFLRNFEVLKLKLLLIKFYQF